MRSGVGVPRRGAGFGSEITGAWILDVGDRRLLAPSNTGDCGEQAADVGLGGVDAGAGPHGSGHPATVASTHLVAVVGDFVIGEAEEPHQVGMSAETAMPHADTIFCRQSGSHKGVRETFHGEGRNRQGVGLRIRPEDAHTWDPRQSLPQEVGEVAIVGDNRWPPQLTKGVDRCVQRHSAHDVRRAGLFPVWRVGPDDLVELDEVDGATTGEERITFRERPARPDEHARSEGCVHLVAAPSEEIGLVGKGTVRRELSAVDSDRDSSVVGGVDDLVDRR